MRKHVSSTPLDGDSFLIRLREFRAFADSGNVRISPLTVLIGRNSSGKSSLLSSLLILKQSLQHRMTSGNQTPLALRGEYCDLGSFRDAVFNHDLGKPISFEFTLPKQLLTGPARRHRGSKLIRVDVPTARPNIWYRLLDPSPDVNRAHGLTMKLEFTADEPLGPSLSRVELSVETIGQVNFVRTVGKRREQHWRVYADGVPPRSLSIRFHPQSFLPIFFFRSKVYDPLPPRTKHRLRQLRETTFRAFSWLSQSLDQTEFVGPFRAPPDRSYAFSGYSQTRSGLSGERAIELLIAENLLQPKKDRHLNRAVSFWLRELGLARGVDVDKLAKQLSLFELNLRGVGGANWANFTDVGFGISQVLPVLVQGLMTSPGSMYLVQQPELHLHPDAQAALVEFFTYLACRGVRCVIETHSEYLLIRLRRRLAEGLKPLRVGVPEEEFYLPALTRDHVSVILADAKRGIGASMTELRIDDAFQFENLPMGFMTQATNDRLQLLKVIGGKNARKRN